MSKKIIEINGEKHEVPADVYDKIIEDGRQVGRQQMHADESKRLKAMFSDSLANEDETAKISTLFASLKTQHDALRAENETLKAKPAEKGEPSIDMEKELAKIKAEFETQLNQERANLKTQSYISQITANATALGLKENYSNGTFSNLITQHYSIEQDGEKMIFRDKAKDELVFVDNKPATAKDIATQLNVKYPELFATATAGFGLSGSNSPATQLRDGASAGERIAAGVAEMA